MHFYNMTDGLTLENFDYLYCPNFSFTNRNSDTVWLRKHLNTEFSPVPPYYPHVISQRTFILLFSFLVLQNFRLYVKRFTLNMNLNSLNFPSTITAPIAILAVSRSKTSFVFMLKIFSEVSVIKWTDFIRGSFPFMCRFISYFLFYIPIWRNHFIKIIKRFLWVLQRKVTLFLERFLCLIVGFCIYEVIFKLL